MTVAALLASSLWTSGAPGSSDRDRQPWTSSSRAARSRALDRTSGSKQARSPFMSSDAMAFRNVTRLADSGDPGATAAPSPPLVADSGSGICGLADPAAGGLDLGEAEAVDGSAAPEGVGLALAWNMYPAAAK